MRILIISDTHRRNDNLIKALRKTGQPDLLIHCGDVEGDEYSLSGYVDCPMEIVAGNNDFFCDLPREREFTIGRYKIWLTHGHSYYVSMGNETIKREAVAKGVDIVMYGHTHKPVVEIERDIIAINPGSLSYPRQSGRRPSCAVMELDQAGEAQFKIYYL